MATEVKQVSEKNAEKNADQRVVDRAQDFWSKNSKKIVYLVTAAVLIVGGFFIYKNYFEGPEELKANEAIWKAEQYYKVDSFRLALNGDATTPGFLKVISRHGG